MLITHIVFKSLVMRMKTFERERRLLQREYRKKVTTENEALAE